MTKTWQKARYVCLTSKILSPSLKKSYKPTSPESVSSQLLLFVVPPTSYYISTNHRARDPAPAHRLYYTLNERYKHTTYTQTHSLTHTQKFPHRIRNLRSQLENYELNFVRVCGSITLGAQADGKDHLPCGHDSVGDAHRLIVSTCFLHRP